MASDSQRGICEVLETCLYVDDLSAAERFYGETLGLPLVSKQQERHVFFRCGRQMLLIFDPAESGRVGEELPPHGAYGPGHVAFGVPAEELETWQRRLSDAGVMIEKRMQWPGGGRSFYFRDPAGNSVEIATRTIWGIPEDA